MPVCSLKSVFDRLIFLWRKVTVVRPIVNIDLVYRALKSQALKSSVYLNTVDGKTLKIIMRQLSGVHFKIFVQFQNVIFSETGISL